MYLLVNFIQGNLVAKRNSFSLPAECWPYYDAMGTVVLIDWQFRNKTMHVPKNCNYQIYWNVDANVDTFIRRSGYE